MLFEAGGQAFNIVKDENMILKEQLETRKLGGELVACVSAYIYFYPAAALQINGRLYC